LFPVLRNVAMRAIGSAMTSNNILFSLISISILVTYILSNRFCISCVKSFELFRIACGKLEKKV